MEISLIQIFRHFSFKQIVLFIALHIRLLLYSFLGKFIENVFFQCSFQLFFILYPFLNKLTYQYQTLCYVVSTSVKSINVLILQTNIDSDAEIFKWIKTKIIANLKFNCSQNMVASNGLKIVLQNSHFDHLFA